MADRTFGHVPGNPPGTTYVDRDALSGARVHGPNQGGIWGGQDGAESVVVSGGYVDDQDYGDVIIYTGQGGRDNNTGRQIADQQLKLGNLGLARSHLEGLPVRVIRGYEGDPTYSPESGYRYDGLFGVDEYWHEVGKHGFRIWRFRLVALDGEAPRLPTEDPEAPTSPRRSKTTVQRIVRNVQLAEKIKRLYDYACQVCEARLITPVGPYAEAAHIQALGTPHNGPDVLANLLCLCPNHHVLFDTGAIYIDDALEVRNSGTDTPLGALRLRRGHTPNRNYLAYHREHYAEQVGVSR